MPPPIQLLSPLPSAELRFESMTDASGLSQLGEMQLGLLGDKPDIEPEALLGKPVTVEMLLRDESTRWFHGYVTRFGLGAHRGRYYGYQAEVRPWLWFLTRTADCRIFQEMTVPEIVKKVFEDHPSIAHYEFKTFRSYRKWVYCVQYRETDFNFVARLLEHEGIYWYFEHAQGEHKLVLVDALSAHDPAPHCGLLRYYENDAQVPPDTEYVSHWRFACAVKSGKSATASYDFERPGTSLRVDHALPRSHDLDDLEMFDYQGDYLQEADGSQQIEDRLTEVQARYRRVHAASNAMGLEAGRLLEIGQHPREDQNGKFLVCATRIAAQVDGQEAGGSAPGGFQCEFEAIPATQQFRPPRVTPKPFVQGPQTAVVVGPAGEEIHTDKYGRVKVQFHWDRYGEKNETSSCWVRVSHPWAGKNFGAMHVPRIGQEVVVDFLEGDPDQPIVTGRVYNAMQMPPWELPANATQSGILTRSSKGGAYANANAIRFEDKAGSEQLWIHAEKNQDIEVENDETHWVGHDRTKTIDHDETTHVKHDRTETVDNDETIVVHGLRTETVDKDETITIHQNRSETVDLNETIRIGVDRSENVGANETVSIGSNRSVSVGASETKTVALQRTHTVGVNETIAIGAAQEVVIGAMQSVTVGAAQTVNVGANQATTVGAAQTNMIGTAQTTDVGADRTLKVGGAQNTKVGKARNTSIAEDDALKVGKNLLIEASESVSITTGDASITMKKDGTIMIKGKDITIQGSGKIVGKADGDLVMKGSKIAQN